MKKKQAGANENENKAQVEKKKINNTFSFWCMFAHASDSLFSPVYFVVESIELKAKR